jgi:hypothetical protein
MKMKKLATTLAVLGLVILLPLAVHAYPSTTQYLTYDSSDGGYPNMHFINEHAPDPGADYNLWAGAFTATYADTGSEEFLAFCIEPGVWYAEESHVERRGAGAVAGGLEAAWLMDEYGDDGDMLALQLAIWEVTLDAGSEYDMSSGNFMLNSGTGLATAQSYVDSISPAVIASMSSYLNSSYTLAMNPDHQNQLTARGTPEPATMLLLGSGMIGLAGFRKRLFKKS